MGDISETGTLLSQQTLHRLFQIAVALSAEQNIDTLLENKGAGIPAPLFLYLQKIL